MLSFIIPTLNEEKTIEETLKSIKELTFCEFEIIVSDGRSKDKTIEISKNYGAKTIVYEGSARQTISSGRNLGASIASGEFFIFLDADVTIPEINIFFKQTLEKFKQDPKLLALAPYIKVLPEFETWADKIVFGTNNFLLYFSNNILGLGRAGGELQMIRAETFKIVKGFDETIAVCEDVDLFNRISKIGKTRIIKSLKAMHTGRRAHKVGWPRLLTSWFINGVSVSIFGRSFDNLWKEVR